MSFRQLENETQRRYKIGDFGGALDLIDREAAGFVELGHRAKLTFFRACLLAQAGSPDAALDALDAGLGEGQWWSAVLLADQDLVPCRGDRLDRITAAAPDEAPEAGLLTSAGESGRVLLALHGGGEVVTRLENPWTAAAEIGWTVHRPVSSQRLAADLATWSDIDLGLEECRRHVDRIGQVDALGSFSLGGSLALLLGTEAIDVPVLMVAPSMRDAVVEQVIDRVRGMRIRIITGGDDQFLPATRERVIRLSDAGADVELDLVPGSGHDFPDDFDIVLADWLGSVG